MSILVEKKSEREQVLNQGNLIMIDNEEDRKIMWYTYKGFTYKYDSLLDEVTKLTYEEYVKACQKTSGRKKGVFII